MKARSGFLESSILILRFTTSPLQLSLYLRLMLSYSHLIFELARSIFPSLLVMIGMAFAVFITPYYVKQYNEQGSTEPFKHFVRDNVTALVINHIKKFLLIFLYTLLLVIPGIIKCLRLTFVTQTTFFDKDSKEGRQSALKASQDLTKGFLFPLFLVFVSLFFVTMGVSLILKIRIKVASCLFRQLSPFFNKRQLWLYN